MDLATHQRKLLGLFRSTYYPSGADDAYIHSVAQSRDLEEGRRNIFLWRTWVLERTCALTVRLLRRRNLFAVTLAAFIQGNNISPFRETQALGFLEALTDHSDRLIRSVAQFELALLKVRQGDAATYVIPWNLDPYTILSSLANDTPLDDHVSEGVYEIVVSPNLPHQFQISPVANDLPRRGKDQKISDVHLL